MEGAIVLAILIPIAIIVLMILLLVRMSTLMGEISSMRRQMAEWMKAQPARAAAPDASPVERAAVPHSIAEPVAPPPIVTPPPEPVPPPAPATPAPAEDDTLRRMREAFDQPKQEPSVVVVPTGPPVVEQPRTRYTPPPPQPSFFERHPDLEKFIGENLINKIGVAVLVVGIGLLLRYAIGQGMISETGRTLIGVAAGGLLMFFGHRLRVSFRAFSSVLVAGGIAVFYSTIAIAFHQYHLLGQTAAFVVMVAITGFSVALAIGYDRRELAVISLLGGFAAPFLVATGEGNYKVLFTYLLILDAGMLVLANYKKWHIINVLSFALTALVVTAWGVDPYTDLEPRPSFTAFAFATGFFLVFFAMNLRYNLKHRQAFAAIDHALLLANTGLYFGLGLHFLSDLPVRVTGLFTVLLGLFYLGFALYFHKREGIPQPLKLLLIGLVLTFISLAAPVQLEGSYITLFWAAEAVLLLWFSHRTGLKLVERASVLVNALMLISLWMDWEHAYGHYDEVPLRPLLNKAWIAGIVATASLFITHRLLRRVEGGESILLGLQRRHWGAFALVASVVVLYGTNMLEQRYQLGRALHGSVVAQALLAYTLLHLLVVSWFAQKAARGYRVALGALLVLCGVAYITSGYASARRALNISFANDLDLSFAPFHYLGLALMVIAVIRIALLARAVITRPSSGWILYLWAASSFIVVLASQELDLIMMQAQDTALTLSESRRVGYPILWGVGSFLFMWYGMRTRMRTLRIIALSLFGITLLKLFLFDLRALSEGGRVAAFIFLGALLLVISFMYQRIKGLFIDDRATNTNNDAPSA
ncbi:MAG TPA: DUF2339 domain-containing protein [Flavobacteriales bacterium]|nr:DUF2339 domain-containing protein [Flavobacteriales bacterium]